MQQPSDLSIIADLEADNQRLRRLLDQRGAAAELRHRLRGTLALLLGVITRSAQGRTDVASYAAHLEDRLKSLMRVQGSIDQNGEVDLATLIADELFAYKAREDENLRLSGPTIRLQPRAGQALGLAIHELAVNAVEHGALATEAGRITATWRIDGGHPVSSLSLDWKETGLAGLGQPSHRGFGTEFLTAMLQCELHAAPKLAYEPDGLYFSLRLPFSPKIGRLAGADQGEAPGR